MIRIFLSLGWFRCKSVEWFAYDNGPDDFGYGEFRCEKLRWHKGDHKAYLWP